MNADSPHDPPIRPELEGCLEACRRCADVVERIVAAGDATGGRVYLRIGAHLRHCLDHFLCLFRALDGDRTVDYDARERREDIESDAAAFTEALADARSRLLALAGADLDVPLAVRQTAAPGGRETVSPSNLGRELVFLSGHTIHHLAIVYLLCEAGGVPIPEEWTMAYSTAAYRAGLEPRSS